MTAIKGRKDFAPTHIHTLTQKDNRALSRSLTHCQWAFSAHTQSQKEDYFYHAGHSWTHSLHSDKHDLKVSILAEPQG